ncbi:MAG TPA: hypothetical protein VF331_26570 [Polyangiales bacterium]
MSCRSSAQPVAAVARVLGVLAALACLHGQAHAWTQTRVTGVGARLDATHPNALRVALEVHVQVSGGWLSRLEILTLDPDLVLASDAPAVVRATDGTLYTPSSSVESEGTVVLGFDNRHAAPWHGDYVATLTYETTRPFRDAAAAEHGQRRVRWQLPGWEVGLSDVHVVVLAPDGSAAAGSGSAQVYGDQVSTRQHDGRSEISFARVSLPRTEAWEIAFDVPSAALAAPEQATLRVPAAPVPHDSASGVRLWDVLGGLCLAALALTKRRLVQRSGRESKLRAQPLVPLPNEAVRSALVAAACTLGGALWQLGPVGSALLVALGVACALDRRLVRTATPAQAIRRLATSNDLAAAARAVRREHLTREAWLDATTLPGLLVLVTVHAATLIVPAGAARDSWLATAWLLTPLLLTATRRHRPLPATRALLQLAAARRSLTVDHQLVLITSADGRWLDARLWVAPAQTLHGAARLELVIADSTLYGRPRATLAWLATCETGSTADHVLARALPGCLPQSSADARLCARLCVTHDVASDAQQLLGWLDQDARQAQPIGHAA